jgi:hypothetical protein
VGSGTVLDILRRMSSGGYSLDANQEEPSSDQRAGSRAHLALRVAPGKGVGSCDASTIDKVLVFGKENEAILPCPYHN